MGILNWLLGAKGQERQSGRESPATPSSEFPGLKETVTDRFDISRKMLKEATALKKEHPLEAIEKVKDAIRVCPEKVLEDHFKLSSYLVRVGLFEEAFAVLRRLVSDESPHDYFMFNMNLSVIENEMASVVFREKKWSVFVYYACSSAYRRCVALGAQGRLWEAAHLVETNPLGVRNGNKAFKEMGLSNSILEFEATFRELLTSQLPKLRRLCQLSPPHWAENGVNDEFVVLFHELSAGAFEGLYKSLIGPLLQRQPNKAL